MAAIDVAGFVADLKDHAVTHGFHVHDERHFVETYSLRQAWEVDLHPEDGCGGPVDLHIELDVDPRTLLAFEDAVLGLPDEVDPPDEFHFPLVLTWSLPPMPNGPDLLRLAIDLAPIAGSPTLRGYKALEYSFHEADIMLRLAGDTIELTPPFIVSEAQIDEIVDKVASTIKHVA